jgi:hypothetical protein
MPGNIQPKYVCRFAIGFSGFNRFFAERWLLPALIRTQTIAFRHKW